MAASVSISTESPQTRGIPFNVDVIVDGAPPGAEVTVTLAQTQGIPLFWRQETESKVARGSGIVEVRFSVELQGPTAGQLQATATDDQDTSYPQATKDIGVL